MPGCSASRIAARLVKLALMRARLTLTDASLKTDRAAIRDAFTTIRDYQLAAAARGVNARKYKLIAFVPSALYAGEDRQPEGAHVARLPEPDDYTLAEIITRLPMVVFGGIGHVRVGVAGAIVVTIINDLTQGREASRR